MIMEPLVYLLVTATTLTRHLAYLRQAIDVAPALIFIFQNAKKKNARKSGPEEVIELFGIFANTPVHELSNFVMRRKKSFT